MLVDGASINLPLLLERVGSHSSGRLRRYRITIDKLDVRERPMLAGTAVVGARSRGAIVRTDQEINGWARLQADFYKMGSADPVEGWVPLTGKAMSSVRGALLEPWEPASCESSSLASIGVAGAQGGKTIRYWVVSSDGVAVRDRPWGKVLSVKRRGMLLRCDGWKDGWVRVEEDYTEDGPLDSSGGSGSRSGSRVGEALDLECDDPDDAASSTLLEGWVLVDGRDLGMARQLQKYDGEKVPPPEEPRRTAEELRQRRAHKRAAHLARAEEGASLAAVLRESKVSEDVIASLAAAGVEDVDELVWRLSKGDHHEELKACGVSKLGARAKLATLIQPYGKALALKEQGNERYRASKFEEAANVYTKALELLPIASTDLALNCYANRAACFQQMREPRLALKDVQHVLAFDPANAKALARRQVYEQQLADT